MRDFEDESLRGRVILVAGASGGIGSATALLLAMAGARVVISGRDRDRLKALAGHIAARTGVHVPVISADLTSPGQVDALIDAAVAHGGGRLDAVVNAAGAGLVRRCGALPADDLRTVYVMNLYAAVLLSRSALRVIDAQHAGGDILHVVDLPTGPATADPAGELYSMPRFLAALSAAAGSHHGVRIAAVSSSGRSGGRSPASSTARAIVHSLAAHGGPAANAVLPQSATMARPAGRRPDHGSGSGGGGGGASLLSPAPA